MKRFLILLSFFALVMGNAFGQIFLYPMAIGEICEKNNAAASILESKMKTTLSKAGIIASNVEGRFVLAAKVDVLQKEITPTAPQQYVLSLMVSYVIGDGYMGTSFASTSLEVKGVGPSEERAFLNALKALKTRDGNLVTLCSNAYDRILDYYNTNGEHILQSAKSLIESNNFDEACAQLYAIPSECKYYDEACKMMSQAVQAYAAHNSAQTLAQAEALWAGSPTPENAQAVMELVANIPTDSPVYSKANALKTKVEKRLELLESQKRADRIAEQKRQYSLERMRISEEGKTDRAIANAAAQVASAYYKSHKVVYHVASWL